MKHNGTVWKYQMIISRRIDSFTFTIPITRHLRRLLKSNQQWWPSFPADCATPVTKKYRRAVSRNWPQLSHMISAMPYVTVNVVAMPDVTVNVVSPQEAGEVPECHTSIEYLHKSTEMCFCRERKTANSK